MRTITQMFYTYVTRIIDGEAEFSVTETKGMESQGWLLIDEREMSVEVEDIDYAEVIKQASIDAVLAKQERLNAELIELTS